MTTRVFQPVDKTVEISVQGTYDGQLVENKFYAQAAETITSTMVNAMATVAENWVESNLLPALNANYTHSRCVARDLTTEASFESVASGHAGESGGLAGTALPGNVTIAIHRATGLSGKKAKSRIYWPGLVAGGLSDPDTLSSGSATSLIGVMEALREAIISDTSATWKYGYVQRVLNHVKLPAGNFIEVFGHTMTDLFIDSMRRRLKGRGV